MGNKLLYIISPSHLLCFVGVDGVPKKQMNFFKTFSLCFGFRVEFSVVVWVGLFWFVFFAGVGGDRDIWPSSCKLKQYKICAYMYV